MKQALITGANRGIGKAITESFLQHGAKKVYAAVRNIDSAQALIETYGDRVQAIHLDLADPTSIATAASNAADVEVVINNAAILKHIDPLDPDAIDAINEQFHINVIGMMHVAQNFAPVLKNNGGGLFAQINSSASMRCSAPFSTYAATKAATYSLTQGLRDKLSDQGTYVLSVHPGPTLTDMAVDAGIDDDAAPASDVPEAMIHAMKAGDFLVFPDKVSREVGNAYQPFADKYFSD